MIGDRALDDRANEEVWLRRGEHLGDVAEAERAELVLAQVAIVDELPGLRYHVAHVGNVPVGHI